MLEIININDYNDSRISLYKSLRFTPKSHTDNNLFIAEGRSVVMKLLTTQITIHSLFATLDFIEQNETLISNRVKYEIYCSEKNIMENIVGFKLHAGIMALAQIPDNFPITQMNGLIIAANGVSNAENIGSIVRNLVGFGFSNFIIDNKSSSPYLRRAVRVSMGSVFYANIHHSSNLLDEIHVLKDLGYKIISIEITDKSELIMNYQFKNKTLIIFGSEDKGLDREILDISDTILKIPISESIESFNVSSSSAAVFYEISRSRFIK